jgi:hypothetical protein
MAIISSNFGELLFPGLKSIFGDYPAKPMTFEKVFRVETSTQAYEKTLGMTGFGLAVTKAEGSGITYDDAYQGLTQTINHVTKGLGFIVTREMAEDDQYRRINRLPESLRFSINQTIETDAASVLNNAFSSTYAGADGLELCSTVHTQIDGGTYKNELTTSADISMTSLEQAFIDIGDITNDRSLLVNIRAKKLVIPTEQEWTVRQLLESDKDPESNYNAINPAKGIFPEGYIVWPYLTDSDAWFILTDAPYGLVYYWRRRVDFTKDNDFDTENAKFKSTYRSSYGWDDPRQIFGSPGA